MRFLREIKKSPRSRGVTRRGGRAPVRLCGVLARTIAIPHQADRFCTVQVSSPDGRWLQKEVWFTRL